jgi:hypothetical protein
MKLTELVWHFSDFFYDFLRILQDLCFYRKGEKQKKRKRLAWAWSNPPGPT